MADFDVFVSYANKDKAVGETACAALEAQGVRCWIAPRDIQPGAEWGAAIVDAIEHCRVMVLIFSNSANDSQQIRREVERAVHVGVPIVPFRIESVTPTKALAYFLGSVHWLDAFSPPLEAHFERLVGAVRAFLEVHSETYSDLKSDVAPGVEDRRQPIASSRGVGKSTRMPGALLFGATIVAAVLVGAVAAKVIFPSIFLSPQTAPPIGTASPDPTSSRREAAEPDPVLTRPAVDKEQNAERTAPRPFGQTAKDIVNKYGNSTVVVSFKWRAYDAISGKPLYHKVVLEKKTGSLHPVFVRLPSGEVVRWLTVDDPDRHNIAVQGEGVNSGFVVSEQGFILTNRHAAAGWTLAFNDVGWDQNKNHMGIIYPLKRSGRQRSEFVTLDSPEIIKLTRWVPEHGGLLFEADAPTLIDGGAGDGRLQDRRVFLGHNEVLDVGFPGTRVNVQASLVRASPDADAALIKVEAVQTLKSVELAPASEDDKLETGDRVVLLGYPSIGSSDAPVQVTAVESGRGGAHRIQTLPDATVSEGIVSRKGAGRFAEVGTGAGDDAYQLIINSTGSGGSGGPVFNSKGQVIGLFTSRSADGGKPSVVPIKYGRVLLRQ